MSIVGSVALVVSGAFTLTALGIAFVVAQAVVVAVFADLRFLGLRRAR